MSAIMDPTKDAVLYVEARAFQTPIIARNAQYKKKIGMGALR